MAYQRFCERGQVKYFCLYFQDKLYNVNDHTLIGNLMTTFNLTSFAQLNISVYFNKAILDYYLGHTSCATQAGDF